MEPPSFIVVIFVSIKEYIYSYAIHMFNVEQGLKNKYANSEFWRALHSPTCIHGVYWEST